MTDVNASQGGSVDSSRTWKIGAAVGLIVVAAVVLFTTNRPAQKFRTDQRFFSDDDGKTWFADTVDNIPPYQRSGKTVVGAQVYSYAGGGKQFCAYLVRFPDAVKQRIEQDAAKRSPPISAGQLAWGTEINLQVEVKAPQKPSAWVAFNSPAAATVLAVRAPDGTEVDQVIP